MQIRQTGLAAHLPDYCKGNQGHRQQDGEKYQAAVFEALPGRILDPVEYPVGP